MKLSIVRYSSDNRTEKQGYWERPLAFLADLFTGVEQRREVDYFSQHFVEEMVGLKELPMDVIYPYVALNQNTNSPMTLKTR
ncbi:MAG: hypothetical protein HYS53_00125, partial [Candidatus Aenigmarchaeota archaeon]|nr:hypothetical protein [Candidatus Aenigmarchaeota archaeon]